jgi:hypothetical protein
LLVLAIGLVVDDAIVVLENIYRRMENGEPALIASVDGSREIGFAVVATTMVLVAVFLPMSFLSGNVGKLFREFGFTIAAAVAFSSLVALTLTPMMTSKLFASGAHRSRMAVAVDDFFQRLSAWYDRNLRRAMRQPGYHRRHAWRPPSPRCCSVLPSELAPVKTEAFFIGMNGRRVLRSSTWTATRALSKDGGEGDGTGKAHVSARAGRLRRPAASE